MKKLIVFAVAMLVCSSAFASGSRGTYSPLGQCYRNEDAKCVPVCGDPINPNFPHSVKSQSNVTGVEYYTNPDGTYTWNNPAYNPAKKTYDPVCFSQCTAAGYTTCRSTYKS